MFSVTRYRYVWYTVSGLLIGLSIAAYAVWGLKLGIDFTGGTLMAVQYDQRPPVDEVQSLLRDQNLDLGSVVAQPVGDDSWQFRMRPLTQTEHEQIWNAMHEKYPTAQESRFDAVGPVIGEELRSKSLQGMVVTLLAILVYVAYAFRKVSKPVASWKYGVVTIFTAFHDVIVPVGLFAVLGHFRGIEVGTSFIAAILTILGYSITDTIVVMDRIRENLPKRSGSFAEIVDVSVRQTFLRSFNTSMTTLLTLLAVFFFGGATLHDFTLTLIVGIAVGTYSSIFIASPMLATWQMFKKRS